MRPQGDQDDRRLREALREGDPFDGKLPDATAIAAARTRMVAAAGGGRGWVYHTTRLRWSLATAPALLLLAAAVLWFSGGGTQQGDGRMVGHPRASPTARLAHAIEPKRTPLEGAPAARNFNPPATPRLARERRPAARSTAGAPEVLELPAQQIAATTSTPPLEGQRQICFTTPGGTRLYWTLDTRPELDRPAGREELRCHEH